MCSSICQNERQSNSQAITKEIKSIRSENPKTQLNATLPKHKEQHTKAVSLNRNA